MKISIVKESLCIGGTERSAANISVALAKYHDVTTVLFDGTDIMYPYGGKLLDMKLPAQTNMVKKIYTNFKRIACYKKHIKSEKPDVVFLLLSYWSPINSIRLKNCIKLVSIRDFSSLTIRAEKYKKFLNAADGLICNAQYLCDYFIGRFPEDKTKVFSVNNIIDLNTINEQAAKDTDECFEEFKKQHGKIVVSAGRFCKEKAFENLLSAFAECRKSMPDLGIVLVGDGDYKEKYLEIIDKYDIAEHVFFTGYQKNPYKYMAQCDAFVLSSLSEGFPNVLAEAMALSLPVVSVNCYSGPAEILMKDYDYESVKDSFVESDYGILTPHYSVHGTEFAVNEMAKAIVHLLSDEKLMKKYSKLSVERAADFSDDSAAERLERIFRTLLDRSQNCRQYTFRR